MDQEAELRYLADFSGLITRLSERFINVRSSDMDRAIDLALAEIGAFAAVDRSYVFQFSADGTRVSNTHEWCAEGVDPAISRMQDTPVDNFAWAMSKFKQGEVLYVPDVAGMPAEAEDVQRELQLQQIQSLVDVPLVCAGRVLGFLGFDSVRVRKAWGKETISLLKLVGEIIAGAIERERALDALTRQARVEMLVANISSRFVNVSAEELDYEIARAIDEIGEFTAVDRSYLFQFSPDRKTMDNTHEWCATGIEPHLDRLQRLPVSVFGFSMDSMQRGEIFHVAKVSDLPDAAASEREEFEKEGIRTLINVPIMVRGRMIGFLGFDAVRAIKVWSENDIRLLNLIGEILAGALERKRVEQRLQASLHEKDVLLREIHHRVKNNLQVIHSLLYLQANALGDNAGPEAVEAFRQSRNRIKAMSTIHDRLYRSADLSSVDFEDYLHVLIPDLVRLYPVGNQVQIALDTEALYLGIDQAVPCGLIVSELITNALKHAFPEGLGGSVTVSLRNGPGGLVHLGVCDNGVGMDQPEAMLETGMSLGLQLVNDLVDQLGGELSVDASSGTCITLRFGKEP